MGYSDRLHIALVISCSLLALGRVDERTDGLERQTRPGGLAGPVAAEGTAVSGRIVDGLGRPVKGVRVELTPSSPGPPKQPIVVTSGDDGQFRGTIPEKVDEVDLDFEKADYVNSWATFKRGNPKDFTLRRKQDFFECSTLPDREGDKLVQGVREFLATEDEGDNPEDDRLLYFMTHQAKFRPSLRRLVGDAHVGENARDFLDLLGNPRDRDLFPKGRKYAPRHEVQEDDLVEAIKAISRRVNFFSKSPEPEITVDSIKFTPNLDGAVVRCGINMAPFTGVFWQFNFNKEGKKWVLRSMREIGRG